MRVLITGASGLLGINLALQACREHEVVGQVNAVRLQGAPFRVLTADLLAEGAVEQLLEQAQPDWVIHCAAMADIDACERMPELAGALNRDLPGKLAAACRGRCRLLHISTDAVFDGRQGWYTEQDPPRPLSVYARTKLQGEAAVAAADPQAIIARINIFGWSLLGKRSLAEWFFYQLQLGQPVKGFTDVTVCTQLATDLAPILLEMLSRGLAGVYHAVGADCCSKYDLACQVARRLGADEELVQPVRVGEHGLDAVRSNNLCLDTRKLEAALGHPLNRLSTGLDRFFDQYAQGYPQVLRRMVDNSARPLNPYLPGGDHGNPDRP